MAHKFIIDNRSGQLYTDFSGRRVTTAAEILKGERGLSPTLEIYAINVATDTRAVTSETINNSNVSVAIGEAGAVPDKGLIKAQWSVGGSLYESTELDIENLTADSLASAFNNAVYPVYNAGGLDVAQIGAGKFLLTLKTNGAIDGLPSLNVEAVDPPAGVEVTTIRTGDSDTKAQYLISLAKLPVAKIASGSWSSATDGSFSGLSASISLNTTAMLAAISRGQREFEISITNSNQVLHRSTVIINESLDPTASGTIIVTSVPISSYLQTNGGTMSGAIAMGSNKITGLADGVASGDAATKGQLDALIDGSPDNLNTLNELAAALNDDQNFSTTVTNNIATKLPKDGSQAMTGALTVPSITLGDSHTLANDTNDNLEIKSSSLEDLILNGASVHLKNNHTNGVLATFGAYNTTFYTPIKLTGATLGVGSNFTPDKTLVVRADDAEIVIDDTDSTDTPRLRFRESGSTSGSVRTDASNLIFETGLNEAARFDSSGHFLIGDDKKIKLGADGDLEIYNATNDNSVIKKTSTGGLFLLNDSTTYIQGTFGEDIARFIKDGANQFYYDGNLKLSTTSSGININGGITFDSTFTEIIRTPNSLRINIDNDGNQTDRVFIVSANSGMEELFRVQEDGKVGIGGAPVVNLDVQGDFMVTNITPRIILKEGLGSKDICLKVQTDGRLSIFDDNQVNEMITVKQDGKVGIGGLPIAQTYIESDNNSFAATGTPSNYHLVLRNPQNDLSEGVGIGFTSSTGTDSIGAAIAFERTGNQAQGDLVFSVKSSTSAGASLDELIRLDGSASLVKIQGDIRQNFINYTDASNYEALKFSAESDHIKINTESVGSFSSEERDLRFNINGTEKGRVSSAGVWTMNNFYVSGSGSLRNYGNTLKLTTGGGDYDIEFNPNDTTRMVLKSSTGRLGINNTNPQKTVDVTGDIRASTNLFASNNIYAAFKFVFGSSTSEGEYIERHGGSDLAFYGNGGHRFTVKGSGDCKIEDAGKGLILATPDGNNTYRVSVDNSGNLVTTQL